jgi:5-methylcytosine-specific restriction endonuclease McrA
MMDSSLPEEFMNLLRSVKGRRARLVIEHILQHGFITTEDLENYGYKHPPRAVRDVRDQGVPIETYQVKNTDGRTIAAYRFADPEKIIEGRIGGRKIFSKALKATLIVKWGRKCSICLTEYEERYLQIDHRIPYEVSGDVQDRATENFMLLCSSCNRAKSWSCEHCRNWHEDKNPDVCLTCYWGKPENYEHIALRPIRRLDLSWTDSEVTDYDMLRQLAILEDENLPSYVKKVLKKHLERK